MALSVSNPQSKDPTSTIAKQSSGIPGLDNTILFSPRQFPTFSSGVHVDRPAKRRRLASPPSHGLLFNFGLVSNASRNESSPPSTYEPGRDIALERPKIAQAAQIEISELSEEAKAIVGYTTEKSVINEQVLSTSRSRLYEDKALALLTGESTIDRTNAITSPDLSSGTEAVTELKNNSVSGSLLSEESQVRAASVAGSKRRSRNKEYVVAKKGPSTGGQYLQLSKEQRTQRGNAAQLAAEMRAKQLVAALAESETDDDRESTSPGAMTVSGPVVHLPTARGTSLPLTSILKRIGRDPTPIKRVHFLTFDKLVRLAESSVAFRERRQRLPTNFDLDVNSTPVLFPPSRKLKIAEAARIDVSELSEETKRIMGYAVERPVDDNTVAPILGAQTDEVKTQASPVSRFSAGKTISAARAKLANGAGAKYNIKSTLEPLTEDVSSIEMNPFVRIRPRFNMPVKDRTARPYIQLPREKKAQQDSTAQTIAGTKGEHLTAAVAQAEEEDIQAADDGERNA
ncbi:hypothetical protein D6D00_07324 [Aureobasidium pullulans]|nr:hypothetical protein D6D00_07324 [Aureobasidium pullulans]